MGKVSSLITTIKSGINSSLTGWTVAGDEVVSPSNKLVDVMLLDSNTESMELGSTLALKGSVGIILYMEYGQSYSGMLDAIEDVANYLHTASIPGAMVGNLSPVEANISSPQITNGDDGQIFRAVVISLQMELRL